MYYQQIAYLSSDQRRTHMVRFLCCFGVKKIKQHKSVGVFIVCHFLTSLLWRDKWHVSWFNDFISRLSSETKHAQKVGQLYRSSDAGLRHRNALRSRPRNKLHCVSKKTSHFLFLWCLWQILSDFANLWQKHTPGNLKQTHVHGPVHISFYMFVLYLVKTSNASESTLRLRPLPVRTGISQLL